MRPKLGRALLAGLVSTILITFVMYVVSPLMTGKRLDVAGMLGGLLGGNWMAGMIAHFVIGTVVLPAVYVLFLYRWLSGTPVARGLTWGVALWLVAQTVVMPLMGGGLFSMEAGGLMVALSSLLGHSVYGLTLGLLTGGPPPEVEQEESLYGDHRIRRAG